jgi:hypothetical protein
MNDTDIEIALSEVRNNPENAKEILNPTSAWIVLRRLMETGSRDTCYLAMKSLEFGFFEPSKVMDKPEYIKYILDRMVGEGHFKSSFTTLTSGRFGALCYLLKSHPEYLKSDNAHELPSNFDDYWESLFKYEMGRRDTLRAWGIIIKAFRGFFYSERKCRISREKLGTLIDSLYGLMLSKKQFKNIELKPGGLPERVLYTVREKGDSERDRFGRVRKSRVYNQCGCAPGLNIANLYRENGYGGKIQITGQKVLAIASCFSEKKRNKK